MTRRVTDSTVLFLVVLIALVFGSAWLGYASLEARVVALEQRSEP
jgi:hypothetical protein